MLGKFFVLLNIGMMIVSVNFDFLVLFFVDWCWVFFLGVDMLVFIRLFFV